jgi:hypothetical protein
VLRALDQLDRGSGYFKAQQGLFCLAWEQEFSFSTPQVEVESCDDTHALNVAIWHLYSSGSDELHNSGNQGYAHRHKPASKEAPQ